MSKILWYVNPLARLGLRRYSFWFPFFTTVTTYILTDMYAYQIAHAPDSIAAFVIFISTIYIIYFSFRDGIRGGITAVLTTVSFFIYIIYTRQYSGARLQSGVNTVIILGVLYLFLASIIGWLKQTIDMFIDQEADQRRRLEAIIQQLPVGVIIANSAGQAVQVNQRVEAILGVKIPLGSQLHGERVVNAYERDKPVDPTKTLLEKALSTKKVVTGKEYAIKRGDGKPVYIQVSASPILNGEGKVIAAAQIIYDITQQKQMEQLKDEFIGIASHELKTPLTSIKGYTQILERIIQDMGNEKATQYLARTNRYIDRLSSLIGDLLDVSRIQAGKLEFNYEEYDFDRMLKESIESFQPFTEKYKIIKKGSTKKKVHGDRSRTEQVITNLLSNAIKYSPDSDKVVVSVRNGGDWITVAVRDFGIGIPKSKQKNLFKRFYRVEDISQKFSGLGIGLYISSEIINRQGGKIWVESDEGQGSTFYFNLPISRKVRA